MAGEKPSGFRVVDPHPGGPENAHHRSDLACPGGTLTMRSAIRPSVTAWRCKQIASRCMLSTNSVLGSSTGHASITNSFRLRRAFSIFTSSSWNPGPFQEPLDLIEFFSAESGVVDIGFIL